MNSDSKLQRLQLINNLRKARPLCFIDPPAPHHKFLHLQRKPRIQPRQIGPSILNRHMLHNRQRRLELFIRCLPRTDFPKDDGVGVDVDLEVVGFVLEELRGHPVLG